MRSLMRVLFLVFPLLLMQVKAIGLLAGGEISIRYFHFSDEEEDAVEIRVSSPPQGDEDWGHAVGFRIVDRDDSDRSTVVDLNLTGREATFVPIEGVATAADAHSDTATETYIFGAGDADSVLTRVAEFDHYQLNFYLIQEQGIMRGLRVIYALGFGIVSTNASWSVNQVVEHASFEYETGGDRVQYAYQQIIEEDSYNYAASVEAELHWDFAWNKSLFIGISYQFFEEEESDIEGQATVVRITPENQFAVEAGYQWRF